MAVRWLSVFGATQMAQRRKYSFRVRFRVRNRVRVRVGSNIFAVAPFALRRIQKALFGPCCGPSLRGGVVCMPLHGLSLVGTLEDPL